MHRFTFLRLPANETLVAILLGLLFALAGSASADNLAVIQDHAFIDNRPSNDPLLTGLNLNLEVTPTDSVGGSAALSLGIATFTSSNSSFPFTTPGSMSWDPSRDRFDYTHIVTSAQFPNISGAFTFTITDANGSVVDPSHNLDHLVVLAFPTNLLFSNNSTTPTFTFTDPNSAPPTGITRAYQLQIYQVGGSTLTEVGGIPAQLTTTFTVPSGVLFVDNVYDFRAQILNVDTAEIGQAIHDPTEDRSAGWAFNFTPVAAAVPEPATILLLGSSLAGLIGFRRKFGK